MTPLSSARPSRQHRQPGAIPYTECEASFPKAIADLIQAKLEEYPDVPGVVVAFHHPDTGHVIRAFGVADLATQVPMEPHDVFDVGSVHKTLKWIMLEQLQEAELVDYDQPISQYLDRPDIPGATLFHLPNHSTGMVDIGGNFYEDVVENLESGTLGEYSYDEMIDFLEADSTAGTTLGLLDGFKLGGQHNYSSYGPLVAGNIAEEVIEQTSIHYMRTHILDELNLSNTSFIGFEPTPSGVVQGYGPDCCSAAEELEPPSQDIMLAVSTGHEGAIFSTACDMLNYTRDISDPTMGFLSAETIESRTASFLDVYGVYNVGRGVLNYHGFGAGEFWGHAGDGMHGHSSYIAYNPRNGVSMAVLTNLRPLYIENNFSLHWEIAGILEAYYP